MATVPHSVSVAGEAYQKATPGNTVLAVFRARHMRFASSVGPWTFGSARTRCVICKQAETQPDTATVTLVVKGVPARVCPNCGEECVDWDVASRLLATLDQAEQAGVQVDIRQYVAA